MQLKPPWTARWSLDQAQVEALLRDQFPELGPALQAQPLGSGWDNDAWLIQGRYVFRFPRRRLAVALLEHERQVLPWLLPQLPLPGPTPRFLGRPSALLPAPFTGYDYVPGQTACRANPDEATRASHAAPLARFLRALHGAPVTAQHLQQGPRDALRRADLVKRVSWYGEQLGELVRASRLESARADALRVQIGALADSLRSSSPAPLRWVHGDLYVRHLLVGPQGQLVGVIDWGDVHLGDPALDLSIGWTYLPPQARAAFIQEYAADQPHDAALWARACLLGLRSGLALLGYSAENGDDALSREAWRILLAFESSADRWRVPVSAAR